MESLIKKTWNSYLDIFPDKQKDIYFTEEYVKLYEDENNEAVCFIYKDETNIFLFPFLRRKFHYNNKIFFDFETAYGYSGPIVQFQDDSFLEKALKIFYTFCIESNYIAGFVRFHPLLKNERLFDTIGNVINDRKTVAIDLSLPEDNIWMNEIHSKNRNIIKKGIKNNLKFVIDTEYKYLNNFIDLYNKTMQKLSADDFYYFDSIYFNKLKKINNSFLGIVFYGDTIIAAAIFFHSEMYGHYHLSGNLVDYSFLSPNNFMLYSAMLELKRRNINQFHLGGGTTSSETDSLLKFKERFSKNYYQFSIGKIIFNETIYNKLSSEWERNNPHKANNYKYFLLKYKY